jgi:ABC-type glycerol-3-phosphate transport system permease component
MNPLDLPNATDPGQPPMLSAWEPACALPACPASHEHRATWATAGRARWPHAVLIVILALELIPLAYLAVAGPHAGVSASSGRGESPDAAGMVLNSLFVSLLTTVGTLVFAWLAAYQLAFSRTVANAWLGRAYLALLLVPTAANVVPLVPLMNRLHLAHSLWALVFLGVASGQALAVCLLWQAIVAIPPARLQTAALDCVNQWQRWRHVLLPACAPTLGLLAILSFVGSWNEFLLPLLLLGPGDPATVGRGLAASTLAEGAPAADPMRTYLLVSLPILFLGMLSVRSFVRALTYTFARD